MKSHDCGDLICKGTSTGTRKSTSSSEFAGQTKIFLAHDAH